MSTNTCNTEAYIISQGGKVIKNNDGTISVYILNNATRKLQPLPLNKVCCEALAIQGAYFDTTRQKCRWTTSAAGACSYTVPFDVVLNPRGNDGAIFSTNPDETCVLDVEFDYLFKFSGDTLTKLSNGASTSECSKVIDVFESIGASMVINTIVPTQNGLQLNEIYSEEFFPKIGSGNLFLYLINNLTSGFYVTCPTTNGGNEQPINLYNLNVNGGLLNCANVINDLTRDLFTESGYANTSSGVAQFKTDISGNSFASGWRNFTTKISDPAIISGITNEKIKLNIRITGACVDFCVLVDNIRLDKSCSYISEKSIFLDQTPGFDLDRIRDNRKSWVDNTSRDHRTHTITKFDGTRPIRFTDYYTDSERLVINSKEIDLDINIASAIENDVWCYMSDNPCILTGESDCNISCNDCTSASTLNCKNYCSSGCCGDRISINELLTQPLSDIKTIEDFQYYLTSELIDAKDRQTLSSYATLRALYDRYMNSLAYCSTDSAKFNYRKMNDFANLIGNYWTDLIEQVVPATTIWGSTRIYANTIFDNQKFKYKKSSLFFGDNVFNNLKVLSPVTAITCNVSATTEVILGSATGTTLFNNQGNIKNYSNTYVIQMNSGCEFIGIVSNAKKASSTVIGDCNLQIAGTANDTFGSSTNNGSVNVQIYYANNPVRYSWSNGATTKNLTNVSAGTYTLTITDTVNPSCTASKSFTINAQPCNLSVSLTEVNPSTSQSDGSLTAVVTGGFGALTYAWSNGGTTPSITNLSAGTYSLTVTDVYGCIATASTVLYEVFSIQASNVTAATIYNISATTSYNIEWGNGTVSAYTAGNNFTTQPAAIYPTPYNGNINIRSLNLTGIKRILTNFWGPSGTTNPRLIITGPEIAKLTGLNILEAIVRTHLSADTSELPRSLRSLTSYNGKLVGDVGDLPSGMTFINLTQSEANTISGSTCDIPPSMVSFNVFGNNTITGNVSCIPSATTNFVINGFNTVSGSTTGIPSTLKVMAFYGDAQLTGPIGGIPTGTTSFVTQSRDNITGDVCGLSGHTNLRTLFLENLEATLIAGTGNTVSGDINCIPKAITQLLIQGFNTISGDVKNMITGTTTGPSARLGYFNLRGNNTLGGNISGASENFTQFFVSGVNTISGNTSGIPDNIRIFSVGGLNTISGDLGSSPTGTTIFDVGGRNSINTYTGKNWTSPDGLHTISVTASTVYNTGLTSTQLDNLLNDLTGYTWLNSSTNTYVQRFGQPEILLRGTATTASDLARAKLSGSTPSGFGVKITLV